ncbi:MAG: endolytic transglycosylase MltG [bacterium]
MVHDDPAQARAAPAPRSRFDQLAQRLRDRLDRMKRALRNPRWPKSRPLSALAALSLCGALALLVVVGYFLLSIHRPLAFGEQTLLISPGDSLGEVAARLRSRGVIAETASLKLLAARGDRAQRIRAGEYRLPDGISLRELLRRIVEGKGQIGIKVTIIEGWTFRQMRRHLRRAPKLKQTAAHLSDAELMTALGHPGQHPEGRFFPDTYYYTAGDDDLSVYREAYRLMEKNLDFAWRNRDRADALADRDQGLILASIITKESYVVEEMPEIAGVFHNRLKKGMRLQADPTVIYGLGDQLRGRLSRDHLKIDGPYNTYRRKGLPPTPISLPSEAALDAAMRPRRTSAYYFVASEDGRHHFSETLAQHNKAVRQYARARKTK